ncbi:MAG: hypothetical protein AAGA48_01455 [Myxococcota bacterium]
MLSILVLLGGCSSTPPAPGVEPTEATDSGLETQFLPGDYGSFMLLTNETTGVSQAAAIGVGTSPGIATLALCRAFGEPCLPEPAAFDGDFVPLNGNLNLGPYDTRYLGQTVSFGDSELPLVEDPETQELWYADSMLASVPENRWIGLTWAGAWPPYSSEQDLFVGSHIQSVDPRSGSEVQMTNRDALIIEWVPTGAEYVTLDVVHDSAIPVFSRQYRLKDDGLFALGGLPSPGFEAEIDLNLRRWYRSEIVEFGHVVDLIAVSESPFRARYLEVGARDEARAAADCEFAGGLAPLAAGDHWVDLADATNDVSLSCPVEQVGRDVVQRIEVPPRARLTVEATAYGDSAVLTLTEAPLDGSCGPCVATSNVGGLNAPEFAEYFNFSDRTQSIYLITDTEGLAEPSHLTIDVTLDVLPAPELFDTCQSIDSGALLTPGNYYAAFTAYAGDLNPGGGGCTGAAAPGGEAMAPVVVPAGATLSVSVEAPGSNPSLYLLSNCNDAFTCVSGADLSINATEALTYTNLSPKDETLYLVMDSQNGLTPFFLNVALF